jgi:hypothetical protein
MVSYCHNDNQAKRVKSIQTKLLETVAGDIQDAFDELGNT